MRDVGLLHTEPVGKALVCAWNAGNPAAQKLTALLDALARDYTGEATPDAIYGNLKSWGAGLARNAGTFKTLDLEQTLAYGVALARRDPDVAQVWPVVLAKNRGRVDLDRLEQIVRRMGQKRALGFLLALTGRLLKDPALHAFARHLRDSRVRRTQDFFTLAKGKRMQGLTEANTPGIAKDWKFRMNTSLDSFQSHFNKFVGHP
jgi:hypothetical protein